MTRRSNWLPEEQQTARNLYERGVGAEEIRQTINKLYARGRTVDEIRHRMHYIGAKSGVAVEPDEKEAAVSDVYRVSAEQIAGRRGGIMRALRAAELREDEDRPKPWHPLRDARPEFLQMRMRPHFSERKGAK